MTMIQIDVLHSDLCDSTQTAVLLLGRLAHSHREALSFIAAFLAEKV